MNIKQAASIVAAIIVAVATIDIDPGFARGGRGGGGGFRGGGGGMRAGGGMRGGGIRGGGPTNLSRAFPAQWDPKLGIHVT